MSFNGLLKQREELLAKLSNLDSQIESAKAEERGEVLAKIRQMMDEHGLTVADLSGGRARRGASKSAGKKLPPKYRDPKTGDTWTGRGIQPNWLKARIGEGKKLEDFAVAA